LKTAGGDDLQIRRQLHVLRLAKANTGKTHRVGKQVTKKGSRWKKGKKSGGTEKKKLPRKSYRWKVSQR